MRNPTPLSLFLLSHYMAAFLARLYFAQMPLPNDDGELYDEYQSDNDAKIEDDHEAQKQMKWGTMEMEVAGREPPWIHSGKFQGDIDGVDEVLIRQLRDPSIQFNALRNRQLIWSGGVVPYELDMAFSLGEVRLLQRAFRTYRRRTFGCIRFRHRKGGELDYLNVVKGNGCYSQVGKTGGKQELSLGRGCLFNETIIHELMHSLGFWHEHSRADRDEHIVIRWENILPGMDSQFDIVSSAIQDTLGEPYDYRSIMHYGSSAFSRNGRNTLEAVVDEYTNVIGTAMSLSELDVIKIMKLYRCRRRDPSARGVTGNHGLWRRRKNRVNHQPTAATSSSHVENAAGGDHHSTSATFPPSFPLGGEEEQQGITASPRGENGRRSGAFLPPVPLSPTTITKRSRGNSNGEENDEDAEAISVEQTFRPERRRRCRDHFLDCPQFRDYCKRISFYFIMRSYCPLTCGRCTKGVDDDEVVNGRKMGGSREEGNNKKT